MEEQTATQTEPGIEPAEQPPDTAPASSEKLLPQSQVNALIAKARREGAESATKKSQPAPQPQTATATAAPVDPMSALAQMQARIDEMEMRTRYVPLAVRAGWDDAQTEDMFDLYKVQRPQDAANWIQEKTQKFGLGRVAQPVVQTTSTDSTTKVTSPVSTQPPISDKGSPAPGGVLDWEREYAENPGGMSPAARQRMDAKYGVERARRMRIEAFQRQAETIKVTKPQG